MKANEGKPDRIIRAVVGVVMLAVSFISTAPLKWILLVLGAIALITAATGFCGLYKLLGISTIKRSER